MKGDFSRETFRKEKHYCRVNMQQGRVQLDADWNEQMDILFHHITSFLEDIIGDCGAPFKNPGFKIVASSGNDYEIKAGHYYVDGILCENEVNVSASKQPDLPWVDEYVFGWNRVPGDDAGRLRKFLVQRLGEKWKLVAFRKIGDGRTIRTRGRGNRLSVTLDDKGNKATLRINKELFDELNVKEKNGEKCVFCKKSPALPSKPGTYLAYLDVWERHLTALDDPEILEPALGGADTATRTKTVWQVKVQQVKPPRGLPSKPRKAWKKRLCLSPSIAEPGRMRARSNRSTGYRGLASHLYRVEIHNGGDVGETERTTFKWSRDNGTVVARIERFSDNRIIVTSKGRNGELGFSGGHWVEIVDDRHELWREPGTFVKLTDVKVASDANKVELEFDPSSVDGEPLTSDNFPKDFNPKARRWDMQDGLVDVAIPVEKDKYMELEDGIEVQFEEGPYRTGDYWLIPARTAIRDIMWPQGGDGPKAPAPEGIKDHFCPLALLRYDGGQIRVISDCREFFPTINGLVRDMDLVEKSQHK